jgi:uncharacterized protein (TIGR02996 family)
MSDEDAFLRAAQAQPDDDTLRLVYADWLEEQGEGTHAAFVRLQVRRSQLDVRHPDRAGLLAEEARLLQKHKRYWNGRVHRTLHRRGLPELIDSRHGLIRTWDYHRGMIGRVVVTAGGLADHPDVVSALGPIRVLELVDSHDWTADEARALEPLAAGVEVLAFRNLYLYRGVRVNLSPFRGVPILDLRRATCVGSPVADLRAGIKSGAFPSVVLFRQARFTQRVLGGYTRREAETAVHVLDPHGKWDALRPRFADLTGELLDPVRV